MTEKKGGPFAAALEAMAAMTPKKGYNLVGVDTFELPGEELFFVAHFDTWEEAEAERKRRGGGAEPYYVYPPKRDSEDGGGEP